MGDTAFVIDGFNLYHSIEQADRATRNKSKWLNIHSLCKSHLYLINKNASLHSIYYFSAYAYFKGAQTVNKHKEYVKALESVNVNIILGKFKNKKLKCRLCKKTYSSVEEKESDVALSAKIIELSLSTNIKNIVVVSGDTDIAAGIKSAQRLNSSISIYSMFPYQRVNEDLKKISKGYFSIGKEAYAKHLFPSQISFNGETISKPLSW